MENYKEEEKYMWRCIRLAQNGFYTTPPNPMVGAVIVHDGRIIGEGYHVRSGEGHAEVNAIRSVKEPELLGQSTIYVSLEPCSHYGKTPPCADLIIEKGIPRIVIGCQDPFPKVAGRGIRKLMDAGREVHVGVLEQECRRLIRRFVRFHLDRRPYVTLKWAESADGYIDRLRTGGRPVRFSSPLTTMMAHKRRADNQAILVGAHTLLSDNPTLNVRCWYGTHPVRCVVGSDLGRLSALNMFDGTIPTIVFSSSAGSLPEGVEQVHLDARLPALPQILTALYDRGIQSLLVEGGRMLLQSFIDAGLWDETFVEQSPVRLQTGVEAPVFSHDPFEVESFFGRVFRHYQNQDG